ncbi:hypothetical protein BJX66DRAFT_301395 [Aspergillus keveii]|uniref:Uncharacterized protein n=1 Tax=Aspergillus keveii TaxID=714993 RepID=A0ABR4G989_9EURO
MVVPWVTFFVFLLLQICGVACLYLSHSCSFPSRGVEPRKMEMQRRGYTRFCHE